MAPRSLFADVPPRYLSRDATEDVFKRIVALGSGGHTEVSLDSRWTGNLRWARNRITTAGETTDNIVRITRIKNGAQGSVITNKLDDASLALSIQSVERMLEYEREDLDAPPPPGPQRYLAPNLWAPATYDLAAADRSAAARDLVQPSVAASVLSAGYIEVQAHTRSIFNTSGMAAYYAATRAEYSVTARTGDGTGSGWAGVDQCDWKAIDATELSARALDKCLASKDPRAVEPGRFTVILEPQALHELLFSAIMALDRQGAENGGSVYSLRPGQSRLGLKVFDDRVTISTDPMDPACGYIPFNGQGTPFKPVTWVERGILKELSYDRSYALRWLGHGVAQPNPYAYHMHGGGTTVEQMIADTRRGLLVTRFDGVRVVDMGSLVSSGVTRDGLWLIEDGRIKFPVKNLRFTESPMFALNNLEQIGPATRVYASYPSVTPSIKVRDFNFTSLADAV